MQDGNSRPACEKDTTDTQTKRESNAKRLAKFCQLQGEGRCFGVDAAMAPEQHERAVKGTPSTTTDSVRAKINLGRLTPAANILPASKGVAKNLRNARGRHTTREEKCKPDLLAAEFRGMPSAGRVWSDPCLYLDDSHNYPSTAPVL